MWVADYFDGDNDPSARISWIQHETYQESFSVIKQTCLRHMKCASMIVGQDEMCIPDRSGKIDHRTLQLAHDMVAAAWRFECLKNELPLFFQTETDVHIWRKWFGWLRQETLDWWNEPAIVRNVITIIDNQNVERGYHAEDLLSIALRDRYSNVPWRHWLRMIKVER